MRMRKDARTRAERDAGVEVDAAARHECRQPPQGPGLRRDLAGLGAAFDPRPHIRPGLDVAGDLEPAPRPARELAEMVSALQRVVQQGGDATPAGLVA